jgi:hypothetical protein
MPLGTRVAPLERSTPASASSSSVSEPSTRRVTVFTGSGASSGDLGCAGAAAAGVAANSMLAASTSGTKRNSVIARPLGP